MRGESTNLPELPLNNDDTVEARITIELFGAIDEEDLVLSDVITLTVRDWKRRFTIQKKYKYESKCTSGRWGQQWLYLFYSHILW